MIELLIAVAILGILVVALALSLRESPARRCLLSAQGLAGWLRAGSASELMDQPARVTFSFEGQGSAQRALGTLSVASQGMTWEVDERGGTHTLQKPVKLIEVETHSDGVVQEGESTLYFRRGTSAGAVVVLQAKEATCSVRILPVSREIEVEAGRLQLPELPPLRARLRAPLEMPTPVSSGGLGGGLDAPASAPREEPEAPPPAAPPAAPPPPAPPPSGAPPSAPSLEPPPPPPPPPPPEEDPPEPPDIGPPEPDAEVAECQRDEDCGETPWGRCNQEQSCVSDPSGRAFQAISLTADLHEALNPIINGLLSEKIDDFELILAAYMGDPQGAAGPDQPHDAWMFQAQKMGVSQLRGHPELPTFRSVAQPSTSCADSTELCFEYGFINEENFTIYLTKRGASPGECAYLTFMLDVQVVLSLNPGSGAHQAQLNGIIPKEKARRFEIAFRGQWRSLLSIFREYGIEENHDGNGDGRLDSWRVTLQGALVEQELVGGLGGMLAPPNCEE